EDLAEDEAYALVRRAWPYRELPRAEFDALIEMHAEGVARRAGRAQGARLHRDGVHRVVKARRGSRIAALTSGGAIPETAQYAVIAEPEGVAIGQVDEDWAVESMAGDIFLLGNESWKIRRVEAGRVRVENAHGAPPSLPFWNGEAPGRTPELSEEVSRLRGEFEPQAAATDEGILLSLGPQNSFPLESVFDFLAPGTIDEILTQAALRAPMWGVRWRWNATRSLAVLRSRAGKKIPFNILRMRTDDLLAQVFPAQAQCQEHDTGVIRPPDHPLIRETLRN